MIRNFTLLMLFLLLVCPAKANQRFKGSSPATRYDVADVATNLLKAKGFVPPRAVIRRIDLRNVAEEKADAVATVVHMGLLQLIDGEFFGEKMVTRYQMSLITSQLMDKLDVPRLPMENPPHPTDVPVEFRSRDNVLQVVSMGYMPLEGNEFRGNYPTSRYTLAAIGARFAESLSLPAKKVELHYLDVPGADPYRRAIKICLATGVIFKDGGNNKAKSTGKSPKSTAASIPPVSKATKENNQSIRDHYGEIRILVSRHATLKTKLINIGNRFDLGEPSAPRFLEPLDEEWIAINLKLIETVLAMSLWLTEAKATLSTTQKRAVKRVHDVAQNLAQQMQESRWRLRSFFKQRREGKRKYRRENIFRKDDSEYDIISPGY